MTDHTPSPAMDGLREAVEALADEWDETADKWPYAVWHDQQKANARALREVLATPTTSGSERAIFPANHGWTPDKFSGDCRVTIARQPCPHSRAAHDPRLPPEETTDGSKDD